MKGRKRHLLVDFEGLVVRVVVLPADIRDRDGAQDVCHQVAPVCRCLDQLGQTKANPAGCCNGSETNTAGGR